MFDNTLFADLRYAYRGLVARPAWTLAALICLAVGTGANTVSFTVINELLLKPLPFAQPDRIAVVTLREPSPPLLRPFSLDEYAAVAQGATLFSELSARTFQSVSVAADDAPRMAQSEVVSANYFAMLRVSPLMGHFFDAASDVPQAVVSEQLWRRRFSGEASIIGRRIRLNGHEAIVTGVAPAGFFGATQLIRADLWLSTAWFAELNPSPNATAVPWFGVLGRLAPGVTREQAQVQLNSLAAHLDRAGLTAQVDAPDALGFGGALRPVVVGGSVLLFGLMGLVVAVAIGNVAGLLLVRAPARRPEIAVRVALGATPFSIVRQIMTECLVLGIVGSALGVALSFLLIQLVPSLSSELPEHLAYALDPRLDGRVLGLAVITAVLVSIAIGFVPARHAARTTSAHTLKHAGTNRTSRATNRGLNTLVVVQMAVSTMLLVGCTLLARAYIGARSADSGMDMNNGLAAMLDFSQTTLSPEEGARFYESLLMRVSSLPSVENATLSREVPLSLGAAENVAVGEGRADRKVVTPGYFATMRIPLLQGRDFRAADRAPVAVVNETMAAELWPGRSPVGEIIRVGESPLEVVGVVKDAKYASLSEAPRAVFYQPLSQHFSNQMTLLLRSSRANALTEAVRTAVQAENPDLAVVAMRTFEALLAIEIAPRERGAAILGALCGVALLFSAVGLYGVVAFGVRERVNEFGLRVALGARTRDVLVMVLGRGLRLALAGLVLGLLGALGFTQVLRFVLADVPPVDVATLLVVGVTLGTVALLASYFPARFATRVDPAIALRGD
jgi:putative ABC transport system permease protein